LQRFFTLTGVSTIVGVYYCELRTAWRPAAGASSARWLIAWAKAWDMPRLRNGRNNVAGTTRLGRQELETAPARPE